MVEKLRNIAFVAHGGAGKTSLAEVLIYTTGVTNRLGRVEDGNTQMDFEPEELKRQSSISSAFHQIEWKKNTITLIDTPGDQNFFSDTKLCMQAADANIVVVDAVDGVKVQTEQAWDFAEQFNQPCLIFINKLDRERGDFRRTFDDVTEIFQPKPIILQLPIGSEADFKGIIDLISMKAFLYDDKGKAAPTDIPADLRDEAETEHEILVENIAEADDALIERYLEGESLSEQDIKDALRKGTIERTFVPVMCGSAIHQIGIDLLMDAVVGYLPSPADRGPMKGINPSDDSEVERSPDPNSPFSGFVIKTVADPYAGRLTIFRVVSGRLGSDGTFYNVNKRTKERFNQLLTMAGKEQKPAKQAGPGSIVTVAKLKETTTGDTICDDSSKIQFQCAESLPTLISFALEPKSKGDEDKIFSSLTRLLEEDPGLKVERNSETREILLSGCGQVHIETTIEKMKRKFNVEVNLFYPKPPSIIQRYFPCVHMTRLL